LKLREDQAAALDTIQSRRYSMLYGTMGSGKTAVAASCVNHWPGRTLIVAPVRVIPQVWEAELERWTGAEYTVCAGKTPGYVDAVLSPAHHSQVVLITPDQLSGVTKRWTHDIRSARGFRNLIVDEVSGFTSAGSNRVKAARRLHKLFANVLTLTGTPVSDDWGALYAECLVTDGGATLGTLQEAFYQRYFANLPPGRTYGKRELLPGAAERLTAAVAPLLITLDDYRHTLPPKQYVNRWLDMPEETHEVAKILARDYVVDDIEAVNDGVLSGKLQQLASGVLYDEEDYIEYDNLRVRIAAHMCNNLLAANSHLMVMYTLRADAERMTYAFGGDVRLYRPTPQGLAGWQDTGGILLAHPKSVGHGLNLAAYCNTLVWIAPHWSRDLKDQTEARIWRTGQTKEVTIHNIYMRDSIDRALIARLNSKAEYDATFRTYLEELK
jgi:hypothetical protein